jgi:hypothetical protein
VLRDGGARTERTLPFVFGGKSRVMVVMAVWPVFEKWYCGNNGIITKDHAKSVGQLPLLQCIAQRGSLRRTSTAERVIGPALEFSIE